MRILKVLMAAVAGLAASAWTEMAQAADAPPKSCADVHAHELDFWVGNWEIHRLSDGKLTGHTRISRIDGCIIREEWTGLTETGGSLNAYDPDGKTWRRLWAGVSANVGAYAGRWTEGHMEFIGEGSAKGQPVTNRMRLTPMPDGSVRQQGDYRIGDAAWIPFIDAVYRRVAG